MPTGELTERFSTLTADQKLVAMATGVILGRITKLPAEDSEELFALLKEYVQAEGDEDRAAANDAIMEILEPDVLMAMSFDLTEDGARSTNLKQWTAWVSERIRGLRQEQGLTQEQLAEKSGLPQSHISRIENAKHSPSRMTVEKLADALGVEVGYFDPSE